MRSDSFVAKLVAAIALYIAAGAATADFVVFRTTLAPETPTATGSGDAVLTFDTVLHVLHFDVDWSGLNSPTTVAHIHCCLASPGTNPFIPAFGGSPTIGVAVTPGTLPGFPAGVMAGHYEALVDLDLATSFTTAFVANFGGGTIDGAISALLGAMADGRAYLNIHTQANPGGQIRGFITVPEPVTSSLVGLALVSLLVTRRRTLLRR
jgi:hypothetical protein